MKPGDLVTPAHPTPFDVVGLVLEGPSLKGGVETVLVEWAGWDRREHYTTEYLKVLGK